MSKKLAAPYNHNSIRQMDMLMHTKMCLVHFNLIIQMCVVVFFLNSLSNL